MARAWDLLKTSNLLYSRPGVWVRVSLLNRMKEGRASERLQTRFTSRSRTPKTNSTLSSGWSAAFRDAEWAPGGWISAFKEKLPEDLEVVLKTGLIELKAKKFDWRRRRTLWKPSLNRAIQLLYCSLTSCRCWSAASSARIRPEPGRTFLALA